MLTENNYIQVSKYFCKLFLQLIFFLIKPYSFLKELDVSENAVGVSGSSALFAMLAENTTVEKLGNKASLKINAK